MLVESMTDYYEDLLLLLLLLAVMEENMLDDVDANLVEVNKMMMNIINVDDDPFDFIRLIYIY
jgi:hypothetical protein